MHLSWYDAVNYLSFTSGLHVGTLLQSLDQWKSLTSNGFVFHIVQGHYLQLRCPPILFPNLKWFNPKAALAHEAVTQKEVDELLAKGGIEPCNDGSGFYCFVFVASKFMDGFRLILNLKHFNHNMHITTSKMPTITHAATYLAYL